MSSLPLDGIRILDFCHFVAGPWGTLQLSWFGAELIKIEPRSRPDTWRFRDGNQDPDLAVVFADFNRNKKSVNLNLKVPEGLETFKRLVAVSDAIIDNFTAGVLERLGVNYETLREIKPDIIMLGLKGLGSTGPRSGFASYGPSLMAYTGMTQLWTDPASPEPVGTQTSYPDYLGGMHAALLLLAALQYRERTGKGMHIDVSQAEVALAALGPLALQALVDGQSPEPLGNSDPAGAPSGCFRCAGEDDWCYLTIREDKLWLALCRLLDRDDMASDPRLATQLGRLAHGREVNTVLTRWFRDQQAREAATALQAAGIPAAPVQSNRDVVQNDPHLAAREFVMMVDHPVQGEKPMAGPAARFRHQPARVVRHAPLLGQDNQYVFGQLLGMSAAEIAHLESVGALT